MKLNRLVSFILLGGVMLGGCVSVKRTSGLKFQLSHLPSAGGFILADEKTIASVVVETSEDRAVLRAVGDLAEDFSRVTGLKPSVMNEYSGAETNCIIIGTLGGAEVIDQLCRRQKIGYVTGVSEANVGKAMSCRSSRILFRGIHRALVIAGQ